MLTRLKTWLGRPNTSPGKPDAMDPAEESRVAFEDADLRVLLVCMGNICRSPMAEGVVRHRLARQSAPARIFVDSAGTHGYHVGAPPDPRARAAAARRGISIDQLRARQVGAADFSHFDMLLAMDRENLEFLHGIAPAGQASKARLLLEYSRSQRGADVPDPYYGGNAGFERVLDLVEEAADGLVAELLRMAARRRSPAG